MSNNSNIAVILLAAGASKRMGTPKQLLKWGNTTLVEHAIKVVQESYQIKIIVVLGANYQIVKSKIEQLPIEIILNKDWEIGLGKSIAFGISHLIESKSEYDGVLIILADQPLIDSKHLNALMDAFRVGERQIIATDYDNNKHGVPVLFDKCYFVELSQLNDDKGAKSILQKYSEKVSVLTTNNKISDIDTMEDYKNLYYDNPQC